MEKKEIKTFVERVSGNVFAEIASLNKRLNELRQVKEKLDALVSLLCADLSTENTINSGE